MVMRRIQYLFLTAVFLITSCNPYELLHIDGHVYDIRNQLPVEDADIVITTPNYKSMYGHDGKITCTTNSEGYFYLEYYRIEVVEKEYLLKAFHVQTELCSDWECNSIDIDPDFSQTVDLYLQMEDSYYSKK